MNSLVSKGDSNMNDIEKLFENLLKALYDWKKGFLQDAQSEVTNDCECTYIGNQYAAIRFYNTEKLIRQTDKYAKNGEELSESHIVPLFLHPCYNFERRLIAYHPIKVKIGSDKHNERNFFIHTKKADCIYSEKYGFFFGDFDLPKLDTEYMLPAKIFYSVMDFFKNGYFEIAAWDKGGDRNYLYLANSNIQAVIKNILNDYVLNKMKEQFNKMECKYVVG